MVTPLPDEHTIWPKGAGGASHESGLPSIDRSDNVSTCSQACGAEGRLASGQGCGPQRGSAIQEAHRSRGRPGSWGVARTMAVKVTVLPTAAGLRLDFTAVIVSSGLTVWVVPDDVLPMKLPLPR